MLKFCHYLKYKGHFYVCSSGKRMRRMEVYSCFWKFCRAVKCYNWVSKDAVASLLYVGMLEL